MDTIKPNPFLEKVESMLTTLGLDTEKAKQVVPNGILFNFLFNDRPVYVCLPDRAPSTYSNICRIEAEVAELDKTDAARLVYGISIYLDTNDNTPVRVAAKQSKGQKVKILIQFVADLESLQHGSVASSLLHCCELADELRLEMVSDGQRIAA